VSVRASDAEQQPHLRIVRGEPSAEEVAALVAVVTALAAAGGSAGTPRRRSEWSAPHRGLRGPQAAGWRSSALPR
jgi:hypothetical protein